ncbi:MAG: choice-of-anchor V domain-containing protein [Rubricoccaceae bacterium]|nr:choice-of-anchor V domain-containing protein [Rubricoccaceae bacterium]
MSSPREAESYNSGAPNGFSGPENYCTACHGDFGLNSGTGSVTITAPAIFHAGERITVTVTVDNTTPPEPENKQGFQMTARNELLEHVGEWDIEGSTIIQLGTNGGTPAEDSLYVTHTVEGNTETSWTVTWVAPSDNPPEKVYFYAAGNAANGNGWLDGDYIYSTVHEMDLMVIANEPESVPSVLTLDTVFPNPFQTASVVEYTLVESTTVTVYLHDALGRTVRLVDRGSRSAGLQRLEIDADDLASGMYFLTIQTPTVTRTKPVTVVR